MLNIGHRGASGSRPENTLDAFLHALSLGAHGIELDVRRCASGELVVIHDATLARTVKGKGRVSEKTLSQLQSLTVRGGGRIPMLAETLEAIGKHVYCFIELKTPDAAADVANLVKTYVGKGWRADRLILITFRHRALLQARKIYPGIHIGASFERLTPAAIRKAKQLNAQYVTPCYKTIGAAHVAALRAAGIRLVVWTVNRPRSIERMQTLGVDGIMTDYPDRVRPARREA